MTLKMVIPASAQRCATRFLGRMRTYSATPTCTLDCITVLGACSHTLELNILIRFVGWITKRDIVTKVLKILINASWRENFVEHIVCPTQDLQKIVDYRSDSTYNFCLLSIECLFVSIYCKIKLHSIFISEYICVQIEPTKSDGMKADDVEGALKKVLSPGYITNLDTFVSKLEKDVLFKPHGELVHAFTVKSCKYLLYSQI